MIISIGGTGGSGKSSLAKRLAEKLNWPRYYMGGMRREAAARRGMTLAEYNRLGETDPTTDFEVDNYQAELGKSQDNFIIEGRTSWYFIPHSIKIYLDVSDRVAAERVFADLQKENHRNEDVAMNSIDDVLASMVNRKKCDDVRYRKYFNIDVYDTKNYDLVVNTTNLSKDEAFEKVWEFISKKQEQK